MLNKNREAEEHGFTIEHEQRDTIYDHDKVKAAIAKRADRTVPPSKLKVYALEYQRLVGVHPDELSLMSTLCGFGYASWFTSWSLAAAAQFGWDRVRRRFLCSALMYAISLGVLVAYTADTRATFSIANSSGRLLWVLTFAFTSLFGYNEFTQLLGVGVASLRALLGLIFYGEAEQDDIVTITSYVKYIFNVTEVTRCAVTFYALFLIQKDDVANRSAGVCITIAISLHWFGILAFLQPFEKTGHLVRTVVATLARTAVFFGILFSTVLSATHAFYVLQVCCAIQDTGCAFYRRFKLLIRLLPVELRQRFDNFLWQP